MPLAGLLALLICGQAPAASAPAPAMPRWTGSVGFNLVSITGNATAVTLNGTGGAELKTPEWIYGLKASATYGVSKATPDAPSQVLALAGSLQARVDRRFNQIISVYLLGGAEADHVKSVEFRGIGEAGMGLIWISKMEGDLERMLFRTDLAFRYAHESRFQYYPTPMSLPAADLYAPKLGVAFRYAFSKDVRFVESAEVLPSVSGDGRVVVNNLTKLTAQLFGSLAASLGFTLNYDSAPAPGKVPTDTALSVGLEYQI